MKKFSYLIVFFTLFLFSGSLLAQPVVVDGNRDAFYDALTGPDDGYLQLKYYASNDNGAPYNNEDLSAKMWAAWDTTWFYFYTEVTDDSISGRGPNAYQSDGIEFKFDPIPTSTANSLFVPNLTFLNKSDSTSDEVVIGADTLNGIPDSLNAKQWARRRTADGYALEVAIKWSAIVGGTPAENVSVAVDSVFGLALNVHDNDDAQATPSRDGSVMWAARMVDAVWNTPAYLGTVKFLAGNKLQFIPVNNITGETNPVPFDGTPFYINVDGNKDPVFTASKGFGTGYIQLQVKSYAGNDNGFPTNDADLSANIWTAWDTTWLYLYQEVRDNVLSNNGTASYQNDGLELKIDPQPTDSTNTGTSIFGPNLTALGGPNTDSLSTITNTDPSAAKWARRIITGANRGYALELAIKWSAITANSEIITPAVDNVFGMAINNHDNDSIPASRRASVMWAAVMLDHVWDTPKYLGTVKFLADNKLQFIPTNNMTEVTNPIPYDGTPFYMRIDGLKDPFYNALTLPANGYLQIRSFASNQNGQASNDADLSAKVWASWDTTWYYMYAEVRDTVVSVNGTASYQNDGLELKIDPQPTDSTNTGTSIFGPNLNARGGPNTDSLSNITNTDPSAAKWSRRIVTGANAGYALELAIKWSAITANSETITPANNNVFGMAINFHDNDVAPPQRVASVMWAAVMDDHVWDTPKMLGTVKFLANNRLEFIPTNNVTGVTNPLPYNGDSLAVGVNDPNQVPYEFALYQNYPNPFNPTTTIQFTLPERSNVHLVLYDILGNVVKELANGEFDLGYHRVLLNASNLASGVYFYRLQAGEFVNVKKLLLLK